MKVWTLSSLNFRPYESSWNFAFVQIYISTKAAQFPQIYLAFRCALFIKARDAFTVAFYYWNYHLALGGWTFTWSWNWIGRLGSVSHLHASFRQWIMVWDVRKFMLSCPFYNERNMFVREITISNSNLFTPSPASRQLKGTKDVSKGQPWLLACRASKIKANHLAMKMDFAGPWKWCMVITSAASP